MTTHFFGDTTVLLGRTMRHITRSPDTIITVSIMPIALMLLFRYVFGGAINTGQGPGHYVNYLLPGILLITIATGISYTALRVFTDMQTGIFERFQSLPIARSSVLWAHVLTSVVSTLISLVIVVLIALPMGFRSGAGAPAWLAVAGIIVLPTLAFTWIAVIAGLSAKTAEGGGAYAYPLIFLPFISSAFVPTRTMPGPVRAFADNQPMTSIINTIRDLLARQPVSTSIWTALAWCLGILIVAYALAMATYHRKIAQRCFPSGQSGINAPARRAHLSGRGANLTDTRGADETPNGRTDDWHDNRAGNRCDRWPGPGGRWRPRRP